MAREGEILEIVEKIDSISGMLEMFPDKVSNEVLSKSANDLRELADRLEKIK